jgi:hypothetical protein
MKADIPFAFNAGNKLMQPGTYTIDAVLQNGTVIYRFINVEQRQSVLAMAQAAHDPAKEWRADANPRVTFECSTSRCALAELWSGAGNPNAYRFYVPKTHDGEVHAEVIVAHTVKAD